MTDYNAALDIPCLTWGDLVATGIEDRQLRSAMTRGLIELGKKRHGKMLYTIRERFTVDLVAALTNVWVPISIACLIGTRVGAEFASIHEYHAAKVRSISEGEAAPDYFELRLIVGNAGEDIALGLVVTGSDLDPGIPTLPLMHGDLPAEISISLTSLFKRHLRFISEHAGEEDA